MTPMVSTLTKVMRASQKAARSESRRAQRPRKSVSDREAITSTTPRAAVGMNLSGAVK